MNFCYSWFKEDLTPTKFESGCNHMRVVYYKLKVFILQTGSCLVNTASCIVSFVSCIVQTGSCIVYAGSCIMHTVSFIV